MCVVEADVGACGGHVLNMAHNPVKVLLRPGLLALGGVLNDSLAGGGQYFVCLL